MFTDAESVQYSFRVFQQIDACKDIAVRVIALRHAVRMQSQAAGAPYYVAGDGALIGEQNRE